MSEREITFKVIEHIGIFDDSSEKWVGQVNIVSWNNSPAKIDIRYWNVEDPTKNRKVGALKGEAAKRLAELLTKLTIK